jgi:hypothetical protein
MISRTREGVLGRSGTSMSLKYSASSSSVDFLESSFSTLLQRREFAKVSAHETRDRCVFRQRYDDRADGACLQQTAGSDGRLLGESLLDGEAAKHEGCISLFDPIANGPL